MLIASRNRAGSSARREFSHRHAGKNGPATFEEVGFDVPRRNSPQSDSCRKRQGRCSCAARAVSPGRALCAKKSNNHVLACRSPDSLLPPNDVFFQQRLTFDVAYSQKGHHFGSPVGTTFPECILVGPNALRLMLRAFGSTRLCHGSGTSCARNYRLRNPIAHLL
jgi:hypothetical protein